MKIMCHRLAIDFFDSINEPIGTFEDHDEALLNSALNSPRQTFGGEDLYPTLVKKAVVLYYALNKNHAFGNGNKRIATATLIVFLYVNSCKIKIKPSELLKKTLEIAKSDAGDREKILKETEEWITPLILPSDRFDKLMEEYGKNRKKES